MSRESRSEAMSVRHYLNEVREDLENIKVLAETVKDPVLTAKINKHIEEVKSTSDYISGKLGKMTG